jgi:hypothetical protein
MARPKNERVDCNEKLFHEIVPHERPEEHPATDHHKIALYLRVEFCNRSWTSPLMTFEFSQG